MRPTHNGVLLPDDLVTASDDAKDAYAVEAKRVNGAFCDAYFALEAECERRGLDPRELFDRG